MCEQKRYVIVYWYINNGRLSKLDIFTTLSWFSGWKRFDLVLCTLCTGWEDVSQAIQLSILRAPSINWSGGWWCLENGELNRLQNVGYLLLFEFLKSEIHILFQYSKIIMLTEWCIWCSFYDFEPFRRRPQKV